MKVRDLLIVEFIVDSETDAADPPDLGGGDSPDDILWRSSRLQRRLKLGRKADRHLIQAIGSKRQQSNHKFVGAGAEAYVYKNEHHPHELNAVNRVSREDDTTALFLHAIASSETLSKNPYFPRVHETIQKDGSVSFKMEKLVSLQSPNMLSAELLTSTYERMFNSPIEQDPSLYDEVEWAHQLIHELMLQINSTILYPKAQIKIADPAWKEASEQIRALGDKLASYRDNSSLYSILDIHAGNIMWRITGSVPHLVITDPFFGGRREGM